MSKEEIRIISPDELAERMRELRNLDTESRHIEGDELLMKALRRLGYEDAIKEFESWSKWYA